MAYFTIVLALLATDFAHGNSIETKRWRLRSKFLYINNISTFYKTMHHLVRILVSAIVVTLIRIIKAGSTTNNEFENTTYSRVVDPDAVPGTQSFQTFASFYPSPWMAGAGDWVSVHQQARAFVSQLTLLEKVNLTTGVG
jgi:hypothetical protein